MARNVYVNIYDAIDFLTPWELCAVKSDAQIDMNHQIYIDEEGVEHKVPLHFTAAEDEPKYELKPKTRVIARRKHQFFPCFYDVEEGPAFIYKNYDESDFLAGVISHECRHDGEYLVFFDDGHAQYVAGQDIRVVNGDPGIEHVTENIRNFYEYYFGADWTERRKADCQINGVLRVFLNGEFRNAIVREFYGSSLMMIHFLEENTIEWIFEGSDRIENVYESVCAFLKKHGVLFGLKDAKLYNGNEELFYSAAYQSMLKRLRGHLVESIDSKESKVPNHSEVFDGSTQSSEENEKSELEKSLRCNGHRIVHDIVAVMNKKPSLCMRMERKTSMGRMKKTARATAHDSNQISHNDAKKAVEFLIILAEIRHEMNRAGNGKYRIELYAENSSIRCCEPIWKRICRFLRIRFDRTALKKLIQNFRKIDTEFRNTFDHYVQPNTTSLQLPTECTKNIENDAATIQHEVTLKVQLMQKYLENCVSGSGGGDNDTPKINLVQHLDEVINAFTQLIE